MSTDQASQLLADAIAHGVTPGAVYVTGTREGVIAEEALGRLTYEAGSPPVTPATIYDLASLTKVLVTTPVAMALYEEGRLELERPVRGYVPEFRGGDKDSVTVADLLAHCGGLLWWSDLYASFENRPPAEVKQGYIRSICAMPLDYPPRSKTVYSDLGFLLLGEVLERSSGSPLDRLAAERIFAPLSMREARFNPPEKLRARIAPTENDARRGGMLRGVVHDENAHGLGGVAPHAGLFATAREIVPLAQMFLNGGTLGERRLFAPETVRRFTARANLAPGSSRALGWDTPAQGSSCGSVFSPASYGHTGFTGTSLWIDPEKDIFVVLLTNRVHPSRENPGLAALRPRFHDTLVQALRAV